MLQVIQVSSLSSFLCNCHLYNSVKGFMRHDLYKVKSNFQISVRNHDINLIDREFRQLVSMILYAIHLMQKKLHLNFQLVFNMDT